MTIVDKMPEGDNTSRVAAVYFAMLEELDPYGLSEQLVPERVRAPRFTICDGDKVPMRVPFGKPNILPFHACGSQAFTEPLRSS